MWTPKLGEGGGPRYVAIADAIGEDIRTGRLGPSERLPPQRELAKALGLNFTTVARGYVEAQRRGFIESRVGQGTVVKGSAVARRGVQRPAVVDLTMNLPPEPEDRALLDRMQAGLMAVSGDLPTLLRYQAFGGTYIQREAGSHFLARRGLKVDADRLLLVPGTHIAFHAILETLTKPGDTILCEALTYPGLRSIAARMGRRLEGVALGAEGIELDALEQACRRHRPKILYLNPTLLNPTTATMPTARRKAAIEIARRHEVMILEDDAYGASLKDPPPAFAMLAPDITYCVAGLSKSLGAGLRIAYLIAPDARAAWPIANLLRAMTVMASPLTADLATHWIETGTADAIIDFVRKESAARQKLVADLLPPALVMADPAGFHAWVSLPPPWNRSTFATRMRSSTLGLVASDAFTVSGPPPEAVRISLGGFLSRAEVRGALDFLAHVLEEPATSTASYI